ncbi:hypothetical protein LTR51_008642 [Lithohypha guttulata]|nr:hypothetical protein LTR51_008642 [Lithohypha guttulata]
MVDLTISSVQGEGIMLKRFSCLYMVSSRDWVQLDQELSGQHYGSMLDFLVLDFSLSLANHSARSILRLAVNIQYLPHPPVLYHAEHTFSRSISTHTSDLLLIRYPLLTPWLRAEFTMKSLLVAVLGGACPTLAAIRGFNYAAQGQTQASFEASFRTAVSLDGAENFTSARLYTMIQEGTTDTPIAAIQAAMDTGTTLLLGLWASSPQTTFDHEIAALMMAIDQYGSDFTNLVEGISVGSEDLYRISATGLANDPQAVGQTPETLVAYIGQVRRAVEGTALSGVPIGHVDTSNVFVDRSNAAVVAACDFLGLDVYPYFQTTDDNAVEKGAQLFFEAYDGIAAIAGGAQVWVTEAGWPTSGPESGNAVARVEDAEVFWQGVACELIDRNINFWWYILADVGAVPSFGISQDGIPLYDLACHAAAGSDSASNSTANTSLQSRPSSTSAFSDTASVAHVIPTAATSC